MAASKGPGCDWHAAGIPAFWKESVNKVRASAPVRVASCGASQRIQQRVNIALVVVGVHGGAHEAVLFADDDLALGELTHGISGMTPEIHAHDPRALLPWARRANCDPGGIQSCDQ